MRFMLMIYDNADTRELLTGPEGKDLMAEVEAVMAQLTASGELVGGEALADPSNTRTVARPRGRPGRHRRAVRRGEGAARPATHGRVRDASTGPSRSPPRWPSARLRAMEVRPVMDRGWDGDVTRPASRTCCASSRRRCSACSSAGTGSSTPARTPSRRRCSRPRVQWPGEGVPESPRGWLVTVASRRLDRRGAQRRARAGGGRRRRSRRRRALPAPAPSGRREQDDTLTLLLLCCHPALSPASQLALTLRAVGGLTTARDRARVPRPGGDDGPAHQPREAARSRPAGARSRCRRPSRARRAAARRRCTCCT